MELIKIYHVVLRHKCNWSSIVKPTGTIQRNKWGVHGILSCSRIWFTFFDPSGRYGRYDGVTGWSKMGPIRDTTNKSVAATGIEKN